MNKLVLCFCFVTASLITSDQAFGEECDSISLDETCTYTLGELQAGDVTADSLKISLNSPSVPAGSIIGAGDIALTNVRSFSDLTPQLVSSFDDNFEFQPGLAIGGAPYWWFNNQETLHEYKSRGQRLQRIAKRTQLGLATKLSPADSDMESDRTLVGVSLSWQLLDDQDVRSSKFDGPQQCLAQSVQALLPGVYRAAAEAERLYAAKIFREDPLLFARALNALGLADPPKVSTEWFASFDAPIVIGKMIGGVTPAQVEFGNRMEQLRDENRGKTFDEIAEIAPIDAKAYADAQKACNKQFTDQLGKNPSLVLAVAAGFESDDGKLDSLAQERTTVWLTYKSGERMRLMKNAPILGILSYSENEQVTIDDSTNGKADRFTLGVGTSFEREDGSSFDLQASWIDTDFVDTSFDDSEEYRLSASYSHKLNETMWLEFRAGTTNSDKLEDASFAGISLKVDWAAHWRNVVAN